MQTSNEHAVDVLNGLIKTTLDSVGGYRDAAENADHSQYKAMFSQRVGRREQLAHELQHAVEVIEDESVIDEASLIALYRRIGQQSGGNAPMRWETAAAQQTGFKVRRELVAAPATTLARSGDTRS